MDMDFCRILSELRRDKGCSQRRAAADLGISQALLSHYENGAREPGLSFVCKACDYYGVTADYMLGRTEHSTSAGRESALLEELTAELRSLTKKAELAVAELEDRQ